MFEDNRYRKAQTSKAHSKDKRWAPAYSRALFRVRSYSGVDSILQSGCIKHKGNVINC